ncbi:MULTISPECIES: transposase [Streptomyces]|uniref:transposase n=1 Tax=Streptomyces TaxID=1883 RepID=UPI001CCBB18B|nr:MULTISPECIES: transposase [Streptomyces]
MDECGQEPVDEHQPALRAGTHGPLPLPGGKPGLVALMPQRPHVGHEFSNHISRQARDPPVADDQCTSRVPHHATMINGQGLDVSSPTMHELVRQFRLDQLVVGPGAPLTDAQGARIEPLLPDRTPKQGGRWRDHREVIDAIAYKSQTGTQWV